MSEQQQVKTVRIHGSEYVTVDERVRIVVDRDGGYDITAVRQYELNGHYFYEVTIRVGEHSYVGTSEIRFGGTGVDKDSPMENAETSAVGRTLGFANVGNVGSIASADEMHSATGNVEHGEQRASRQQSKPEDRNCDQCGAPMNYREGTTRDGKPYRAYFCSTKCGASPVWLDRGQR